MVGAGNIHQHGLHAGASRAEIVHGVHVADIETFFGSGVHLLQRLAKDFGMWLFVADQAGVGDGAKAIGDVAAGEDVFNLAVGVGDDADPVARADLLKLLARACGNDVPVGRLADVGDQLIADDIFAEPDFLEKLAVEHPPEAVIGAAVLDHARVKLILSAALELAEKVGVGRDAAFGEGRVNAIAIGEEQGIADVEEDEFDV